MEDEFDQYKVKPNATPASAVPPVDEFSQFKAPTPTGTISRSRPEDEGNALERFGTRATGMPIHRIISDPNKYLNPFSKAYQEPNKDPDLTQEIDSLEHPSQQATQPIHIPGADTVRDIKAHNYAGALGDVAPGAMAAGALFKAPTPVTTRIPVWKDPAIIDNIMNPPAPPVKGLLPSGPLITPAPAEPVEPIARPAASQIIRGPKGRMTKQFLTGEATPGQGPTPSSKVQQPFQAPELPPKAPPQVRNGKLIHGPEEGESEIEQARRQGPASQGSINDWSDDKFADWLRVEYPAYPEEKIEEMVQDSINQAKQAGTDVNSYRQTFVRGK